MSSIHRGFRVANLDSPADCKEQAKFILPNVPWARTVL